ncbi:MAG: MerR family transcriptional regulator [Cellulosilyticaceae bacterium]
MKKLYAIGEVAKIKNVTIKALRYYHQMGIIEPAYIDEETGYRYYTLEQFMHIDIVKYCRGIGVSIKEIQHLFASQNTQELLAFLKQKKKEVEQTMQQLEGIIQNIDELSVATEHSKLLLEQDEPVKQYLEERQIAVMAYEGGGEADEMLYYSKLKKLLMDHHIHTLNYGRIYKVEGDCVRPCYVAAIIQKQIPDSYDFVRTLPAGEYLLLSYTKANEADQIQKLKAYMTNNNLEMTYFLEMDLLVDFFNTESYSCQIQILI